MTSCKFTLMDLFPCAEVCHVEDLSPAADWWSVGALLYELITSKVNEMYLNWSLGCKVI